MPLESYDLVKMLYLLTLDSQVQAGKRNWQGSLDSCIDAVDLSVRIGRGSAIYPGVLVMHYRRRAEKHLWKIKDNLTINQISYTAGRLEKIAAQSVPLADMLEEEKLYGQRTFTEIFRQPNWRKWYLNQFCDMSGAANNNPLIIDLIQYRDKTTWDFLIASKHGAISEYTDTMDQWIICARRPYAARFPLPKEPRNPFSRAMISSLSEGTLFGYTKVQSLDVLLITALVLQAHCLEHGRYPDKLDELVPSYMRKIPDDPFALKKPLVYKKKGSSYVLYSIGPDGKDDGGTAIVDRKTQFTEHKYEVNSNSRGDIVFGVNFP